MNCENAIMSCENLIMNRKNSIVNQLPSEIFLLQSVSFLIKISCKKLPPSLVFLLQCTPVRSKCQTSIKISFVSFFDEAKSWTSKSDSIVFNSLGCKFFCLSGEISAKEDVFRNRRAPSPTLKISCTRKLWPGRPTRGPLFTPLHTRLQIVFTKSFCLFSFVSLVLSFFGQEN